MTSGSIGGLPNGQRFGKREDYPTPFSHRTVEEAFSDLPNIANGHMTSCIPFPDHRLPIRVNRKDRAIISIVPTHPPGQGYDSALRAGLIPLSLKKSDKKETKKTCIRINKLRLMPTVTTTLSPMDGRVGTVIHWEQHRPITIQEARRTQGIPDHEVIMGSAVDQFRVIGNGVDRSVSLAIGLSLRNAMEQVQRALSPSATVISPMMWTGAGTEVDMGRDVGADDRGPGGGMVVECGDHTVSGIAIDDGDHVSDMTIDDEDFVVGDIAIDDDELDDELDDEPPTLAISQTTIHVSVERKFGGISTSQRAAFVQKRSLLIKRPPEDGVKIESESSSVFISTRSTPMPHNVKRASDFHDLKGRAESENYVGDAYKRTRRSNNRIVVEPKMWNVTVERLARIEALARKKREAAGGDI